MPNDGRVELAKLAEDRGFGRGAVRIPPLAQVGRQLFICVLVAIFAITLTILWVAFSGLPRAPEPPSSLTAESVALYKQSVAVYKDLVEIRLQWAQQLFQQMVVTALLPVLMATLGYIFGRSRGRNSE